MYLIKQVGTTQKGSVTIESGISAAITQPRKLTMIGNFWGEDDVRLGDYCDMEKLAGEEHCLNVSYTSTYKAVDIGDGFKRLEFWISSYEPNNVEGYILFMNYERDIETNGEKLFGRWQTEIIVVLREGQYIEFSGKRLEVVNGGLFLRIDDCPICKKGINCGYTHAHRAESLITAEVAKSSLANPKMYARIDKKYMPDPKGEVYRG